MFQSINMLAVIVAGVAYFMIGGLWYSPPLFTKPFMRYRNATEAELGGHSIEYVLTFVSSIVVAFVLAGVVGLVGATTLTDGLLLGVLVATGFALTASFTFTVFSGPHKMLWVIYGGYMLVGYAVMGAILALWR